MKNNNSIRTGIYIDRNLLARCDENISRTNASSRSEFISDAIEMYLSWLNSKETSKILTPALESVIGGKIATTENHIARVLFKQFPGSAASLSLKTPCEFKKGKNLFVKKSGYFKRPVVLCVADEGSETPCQD